MNMIKKHKNLIFSIAISFLWICLISMTTGIYFETNDDRLFSEIFSGAMTGVPEFRSYYIHPFLGLIITLFYHITTVLPWYGLFLILFQELVQFQVPVMQVQEIHPKHTFLKETFC